MTPVDALRAFIYNWQISQKSRDDEVTLEEFIEYYDWVSSSIDNDQYFELMIRNGN
jgi:hypothetical protein